ncbi:MAG: radical SAM protein [Planctomycetota bacterium]|nr:radical SAM protein [Planctomycetota bacterium]
MGEEFEMLRIEVEVDEKGKLKAKPYGMLAEVISPYLEYTLRVLNGLKVIARRDGRNVYNLYSPPQPSKPGLRFLERRLKEKAFGYVFPGTANLAVTMRCQCRCIHCSAARFFDPSRRELTTDELKMVIESALRLGVSLVIFVGGEPLLRDDIYGLISYVDKERAITSLFTNGKSLDRGVARRLKEAGLDVLYLSIDSPYAEEHNRLRGVKGLFEEAIEGAIAAKEEGILIGLSTYMTHERLAKGELEELLEFAQRTGFHEVTIFDCIPSGRYLHNTDCILSADEKRRIVELQRKYHNSEHPMGVIAQAVVNSPEGAGCFGAYSQFYMTPYGDINPCDFNPISFGNVLEEPLEKIWYKMVHHPDFCYRYAKCRMQAEEYRRKYIDPISEEEVLPIPVERYGSALPIPRDEFKRR